MEKDVVSVIVPIYNIEKYIDRCVESIVAQTYQNLEIILVDDGSTDNSGLICDEWEKKDKRIEVIHKINGGLSDARNTGIEKSRGELVSFIDGDDEIDKEMYEKLVKVLYRNNADISMCRMKKIEPNREYPTREFLNDSDEIIFDGKEAMRFLLLDNIDCSVCLKVYRRKLFNELRFPFGKTNEDFAVLYKLFYRSKRIVYIQDILYFYYYRKQSITSSSFSIKQFDKLDNCLDMIAYISDNAPDIIDEARYYLLMQSMYLLKKLCLENMENQYDKRYKQLREILQSNSNELLNSKYLTVKEKAMYLCLAWFPMLYKIIHRGRIV